MTRRRRQQDTQARVHDATQAEAMHSIGDAARLTGVSAKMIRHYESIGLIPPATRTAAGYRLYAAADLHRLRFVRRARSLGFSMHEITALLALWQDPHRASRDVKRLAQARIAELERKIAELQAMQRTLRDLAGRCHGDMRPQCPVLDDLAGEAG
jgi:MerR family copper efflux transcriptional regulator